jgi:hypothetical protein
MATVTGYSPEEEEFISRRGSGAGRFKRPGEQQAQGFAQDYLSGMMSALGNLPLVGGLFSTSPQAAAITGDYTGVTQQAATDPRLTGNVEPLNPRVTTGGGGRNAATGRVTSNVGNIPGATPQVPGQTLGQRIQNQRGLGRAAFLGGMVPGVLTAASEAAAGRAVGAGAALGAGALTSGLGTALLKAPNPLAKLAGGALMLGGMAIPGMAASGAESVRQEVTGRPTEGKEGDFQTEVARRRQLAGVDLELGRNELGMRTDNIVDLTQRLNQVDIEQQKAQYPILSKMKNDELIRSQAMLNSQNNAYMQQMVLGTASNLVLDAQRERGALARQYIASSPYNVVLAAPNVSIG